MQDDTINFDELMSYLEFRFHVEEIADYILHPEGKGEFIMVCAQGNYRLTLKERQLPLDVQELDSAESRQLLRLPCSPFCQGCKSLNHLASSHFDCTHSETFGRLAVSR